MPQFKCSACRAGLYSAAATTDLIDPRCPSCGSHEVARLDAERWLDDGGSFSSAAVARVRAEPIGGRA